MENEIIHDPIILSAKCAPVTGTDEDIDDAVALSEALRENSDRCVGLAANMIGIRKRIIVVLCDGFPLLMLNPEIIKKSMQYDTEEGCLSIPGVRKTRRYKKIKVKYLDLDMKPRIATYEGVTAQAIQHEIDHLDGILI